MGKVVFIKNPKMKDPIFIEGLPGIGNVGKIAADHLKEKLKAKKFANIYSKYFPPQVTVDDDCVAHLVSDELWHVRKDGKDIVLLLGDHQAMAPEGHYEVSNDIMEIIKELRVAKIFTLGGYGTGLIVEEPRVLGAVSSAELKPELKKHGVTFAKGEPGAGIIGVSGMLLGLGKIEGIDSVCLMGETSGYFLDHKSAAAVLKVLTNILGFTVDMSDLEERSKHLDELTEKIKDYENRPGNDLGYFG